MAKAVHQHGSDGEGRKLGERSGLDIVKLASDNQNYLDEFSEFSLADRTTTKRDKTGNNNRVTRLNTRVVLAVNAADKMLHNLRDCAVSKRRC